MPKPIRIGFTSAEPEDSDVYRIPLRFMRTAVRDANLHGLQLELLHSALPTRDAGVQIGIIHDLVQQGAAALLVHPCDVQPLVRTISECVDSGIPVIVLNLLRPRGGNELLATSFIGFDNRVAGELAAYACLDYLGGPGCIGPGKQTAVDSSTRLDAKWYAARHLSSAHGAITGRIVVIEGVPGSFTSTQRVAGFRSVISRYSEVTVEGVYPGMWSQQAAAEVTERILSDPGSPSLNVIWAACNDMAYGAIDVLERRTLLNDRQDRAAGGIAVVTNDGTPRSLELVRVGKITAEVWHGFPEWGWHGVEFAVRAVLGQQVPDSHDVLPRVEHQGNIGQFHPVPQLEPIQWPAAGR